ncbi:MAG TPA: COX15/CtaA family protein [Acetobacteraceae bacterium]|nr:COX15/CtaA family protein [Acetobacteraceae bacterium]
MPFDVRESPAEWATASRDRRLVAIWLFVVCAMILIMVVLGGITRLTGSGLSIMEWAPLQGVLPPLNHAEWEKLFALYRTIPQYQLLHAGSGLTDFKQLFWLEWVHRLWGRLIGVAFFVPLVWFWATGRVEGRLRGGLAVIFLIGGLQGAVGWFMVASGFFPDSTSVAPYRLAIHFALALALYAAVLWCALGLLRPVPAAAAGGSVSRRLLQAFCIILVLTIVAGSFVAGTHAGFEYNTFPLMEGRLVPINYARSDPLLSNLISNPAAVQFDHRLLATLTVALAALAVLVGCNRRLPRYTRVSLAALGALVALQYALGVATLLLVVPIPLAVAHQANAVVVLTAAIVALHSLRRPSRRQYDV